MAFEEIKAEIGILLGQLEHQPEDRREIYLTIHEKLNEIRAMGMPVPGDLVAFEKALEEEFGTPPNSDD